MRFVVFGMANAQDALKHVPDYLDRHITLDDLDDLSASDLQMAYQAGDGQDRHAIQQTRSIINAFELDEPDAGIRQELAFKAR